VELGIASASAVWFLVGMLGGGTMLGILALLFTSPLLAELVLQQKVA
jgi:hypothetical protein